MTDTEAQQICRDLADLGFTLDPETSLSVHDGWPTLWSSVPPGMGAETDSLLWRSYVGYRKALTKDGFRLTNPTFVGTTFSATVIRA